MNRGIGRASMIVVVLWCVGMMGCVDAVQRGLTAGISDGVKDTISDLVGDALADLLSSP